VNQLVQVNTLQQQIQMNQTLDGGPTLTGASSGILQQLEGINQTLSSGLEAAEATPEARSAAPAAAPSEVAAQQPAAAGNPEAASGMQTRAAAEAVATALAPHQGPVVPDAQRNAFRQFAARIRAGVGK
jgi:hypothetical protein